MLLEDKLYLHHIMQHNPKFDQFDYEEQLPTREKKEIKTNFQSKFLERRHLRMLMFPDFLVIFILRFFTGYLHALSIN